MSVGSMLHSCRATIRRWAAGLAGLLVVSLVFSCRAPEGGGGEVAEEPIVAAEATPPGEATSSLPEVASIPAEVDLRAPETFVLTNGLEVWLLPSTGVPVVTATLVVSPGAQSDPVGKEGLTALAWDLLDEGAGGRDAVELADEIEVLGASLSISTGKEWSTISMRALARNLERSLELLGDVIVRPRLAEDDWQRVRRIAADQLRQRREDPRAIASVVANRHWYAVGSRYGHPEEGYVSSVERLTLEDAREHLALWLRPRRAVLLLAGAVERQEVEPVLERVLADWKPEGPAGIWRVPSLAEGGPQRVLAVERAGAPQTVVRVLLQARSRYAEGAAAEALASVILGGTFNSRLNSNLREEKKITYGAFSATVPRAGPSYQVIATDVEADQLALALAEIYKEVSILSTGRLRPGEHTKAVSTRRARLIASLGTQAGIASLWETAAGTDRAPERPISEARRLLETTEDEVAAICERAFVWRDALVVLVGDRASIEAELEELRDQKLLSLTGASGLDLPPPVWVGPEGEGTP